ncbi:MAG: response regulator [Clostridia bacterium]|nr:response regulator [Clostridia bacterium]NCC75918.1 response regulator [Clostridia bacterium]
MYKILLSDDEQIVLDSLSFIIQQHYGDECQVTVARTGREAITQAELIHPDLAIMDINMPGINGIDAIKTIRETSPGTQFILLTALDKFDYAKQAVSLGVLEYLMKPFNKKRIVETMDTALALVDARRQKRLSELAMREKLENVRSILETGFFYSVIFADEQEEEIRRYLELLDLPSPNGLFLTLEFGERHPDGLMPNRIGQHMRLNRDFNSLRESIKLAAPCLVGPLLLNRIVVFLPVEADFPGSRDTVEQIFQRVARDSGVDLRMGISSLVESTAQFHDAYRESLLALQQTPTGELRFFPDLLPLLNTGSKGYLDWLETSFLQAIRQGDSELASQYLNQVFTSLETVDPADLPVLRGKALEWLILAARQNDSGKDGPGNPVDLDLVLQAASIQELRQVTQDKIRDLAIQMSGVRGRPVSDIIAAAKKLIDENYAGNVSLESVAESIALSPHYFSRLFSSQVGKTFIDYLTDLRMAKACQLLREGRLSIKEVSSAIGYTDPNYFSRIFKKIIGQTPTEYRV